ncbi:MAG: IS256 family transposase [Pseudomonadota bacterium]
MPNKRKGIATLSGVLPGGGPEALQELIAAPPSPEQVAACCRGMKKDLLERVLEAELTHHLGYPKGGNIPLGQPNHRNGTSLKTIFTDGGAVHLEIPRDRVGTFEPLLVNKHRRRFHGLDQRIMDMYARGHGLAEVEGHLRAIYGPEVAPELLGAVAREALAAIEAWRRRSLEPVYPVVFFQSQDLRGQGAWAPNRGSVHLALGVQPDGTRDILGLWTGQGEGPRFWLKVLDDLGRRGVSDVLIAVVADTEAFPESMQTGLPSVTGQACVVHIIRNSLPLANWRARGAAALRPVYAAAV